MGLLIRIIRIAVGAASQSASRGTLLASIVIALRMVRRNKLRACLTIIGITIGIAAVVTMIALGDGARSSVASSVQSLGSNALIIFPRSPRTSGAKNNNLG